MNVVFTGAGHDKLGNHMTRDALSALASKMGHRVQSSVTRDTEVLVASRVDTVKARKASSSGIPVITYPVFVEGFLRVGV